jgi:hypothetical protein
MIPFAEFRQGKSPAETRQRSAFVLDWLSFILVESALLLHQKSTCDRGLKCNRTTAHPLSDNTAKRNVWRIETLVVIRLPFQLVPVFENERARREPDANCAQQSLRNADVTRLLCVDA